MNRHEDSGGSEGDTKAVQRPGEEACCSGHDQAAQASQGCCGGKPSGGGCCGGGGAQAPSDQIHVFSRRQIRELDRLAVDEFAIPSILLMENAARGVAGVILEGLQGVENPPVLIVCGPGNNGGDGLAVARHLTNRGIPVAIVLAALPAKLTGDPLINYTIARKMGIPIFETAANPPAAIADAIAKIGDPVVIADALLGTGLDRPATGLQADLIAQMNTLKSRGGGCTLVAIDVPSGLDCDTGLPATDASGPGPAIEADLTIALAGVKAGFLALTAQKYVGELVVVDIGAPRALIERLGRPLTAAHPG